MTTPDEHPPEQPTRGERPGSYGEIAPGVPRYGQYAPEGWVSPIAQPPVTSGPSGALAGDTPAAAAYPGFAGGAPDTPRIAPKQVMLASTLIRLAGLLQALSGVLLVVVLFLPELRATMTDTLMATLPDDPAYNELLADGGLLTTLLTISAVISLAAAACYFWLAAKIRRGARWARTTALVLACVSVLALAQPNVFTILQIGLGIAGVMICFSASAKEYFAPAKRDVGPRGY